MHLYAGCSRFRDNAGCSRSSRPCRLSTWRVGQFVAELGIMELRRYGETDENQRFPLLALSGRQFATENCVKRRDAETTVARKAGSAQWYSGREGVHPFSGSVGDTPATPSALQPTNQGPEKNFRRPISRRRRLSGAERIRRATACRTRTGFSTGCRWQRRQVGGRALGPNRMTTAFFSVRRRSSALSC